MPYGDRGARNFLHAGPRRGLSGPTAADLRTGILLGNLSNSALAVRRYSEGWINYPGWKLIQEKICRNIWLLFNTPRDFAGGLQPVGKAKSVRKKAGGEVVVTDGPYLEAKEHVGGLWLLKCADMDEAVEWARKAAVACRVPAEVREFLAIPEKWKANPERET